MIIVILLVVPLLLATWFAYWFTGALGPFSNRTSRLTGLVCPSLIAVIALIMSGPHLGAFGIEAQDLSDLSRREFQAALLSIAGLLVIPTLLLSLLAGSLFKDAGKTGSKNAE